MRKSSPQASECTRQTIYGGKVTASIEGIHGSCEPTEGEPENKMSKCSSRGHIKRQPGQRCISKYFEQTDSERIRTRTEDEL